MCLKDEEQPQAPKWSQCTVVARFGYSHMDHIMLHLEVFVVNFSNSEDGSPNLLLSTPVKYFFAYRNRRGSMIFGAVKLTP